MKLNVSQTENFILLLVTLPCFFDLFKFFYYFPYHSGLIIFISVHAISLCLLPTCLQISCVLQITIKNMKKHVTEKT